MNTYHDILNPKLYNKEELKPEVLKKLKEIASSFIDFLEIPKEAIEDIVITGSCASYNYTPHSDIDLHIIVDPEKVHEDCPIVGEYLLSKKSEFNQKHDIFIYGIPVEVYTELKGQGTVHNGLYSLNTGWIDFPKRIEPTDNDTAVKAKYEEFVEAAKEIKEGDLAEKLLDKIKRMRKSGLEKGGEFSVENLVFKKLRNEGIIEKLMKIKKEEVDRELSLEESYEYLIQAIEEMICTSTAVMAPYPVDVVGRPAPFKKGKSKKKSHGEKRAPHTEVSLKEEYEKQSQGSQKSAMRNYKYKKTGALNKLMAEVAKVCEAIIEEGRQEGETPAQYKNRVGGELLSKAQNKLTQIKAERRNADNIVKRAQSEKKAAFVDADKAHKVAMDLDQKRLEAHKAFIKSEPGTKEESQAKADFEKYSNAYKDANAQADTLNQARYDTTQKVLTAQNNAASKKVETSRLADKINTLKKIVK